VLAGRARAAARAAGASPAVLFHLGWARVLAALAGRGDVVFGTVLLGRAHAGTDTAVGPFINTLPVRADAGTGTVAGAVDAMRAQLAALIAHEHAPLALAQRASGVPAPAPLFTALLNYRHNTRPGPGTAAAARMPGIEIAYHRSATNYPVTVSVDDDGTGFAVRADVAAPGDPQQAAALLLTVVGGLAAAMVMFGRFAQSAQYSVVEGQPGAAAAILQSMRGGWTVTPAVSANRNMDVVHRAVGKPGVVLVGEGSPTRLPSLLAAEKKRISRVAHETPIYDFQVGNEEGQVPIRKLQRKVMRLPRNLKGAEVTELNYRLKALPQSLQAPKGPMPKSGRMPRQPRPRIR